MSVTFVEQGVTWIVKMSKHTGEPIYKDAAHLGGPWSDLHRTCSNSSVRRAFRNRLWDASQELVSKICGNVQN